MSIEAEELLAAIKQTIYLHSNSKRYLWSQASERYLKEIKPLKTKHSFEHDSRNIEWLDNFFQGKHLDEINKDIINKIIELRQRPHTVEYSHGQKRSYQPGIGTVNRFLTTFRSVLIRARDEWEWVGKIPKIKKLKGETERLAWITRDEADVLLSLLPDHLKIMAEFSLQTGLRRTNVTHLKWSEVDIERKTAWVLPSESKNRKAISVPLSEKAVTILKKQLGQHEKWVFPYRGKPILQTSTKAWYEAIEKASRKIAIPEGFCWHSLRHTWASWHIQKGTPINILKELGGWSDLRMVMRYAHLNSEHLRSYVDN